jgi:hypothetical protein
MGTELHNSQKVAIDHVSNYARGRRTQAQETISHILGMTNIPRVSFESAVSKVKKHARVALHFHPDRPDPTLKTVAEALLEGGIYKSQFETQLSSGSVSAFPGGDRDVWEEKLFGGAYQMAGSSNNHRPKYGALDLMRHPDGPSPRFGSCYFLLRPEVSQRCTFTYLDSHEDPKEKGTFDEFDDILAALLSEAFFREFAIGEKNLSVPRLVNHLLHDLEKPLIDPTSREPVRNLNHYIEAQVHGDISLGDDIDTLVADPSFRNSEISGVLKQLCARYHIELYWHRGFSLSVTDVPIDFRGPKMPSLAERISLKGQVDALAIGKAAMDLKRNPTSWHDRGSQLEVLQELRYLWHVLVRHGKREPVNEL